MIDTMSSKPGLTRRERFCKLYDGEKVDRTVRWEAYCFWKETVAEWKAKGGLPQDADAMRYYNFDPLPAVKAGLGLSSMSLSGPPVKNRVIENKGNEQVIENDLGKIWRVRTDGESMPQWIRFPVENHADWLNKIKPRLNPAEHDFGNFQEEANEAVRQDDPLSFFLIGLYDFWRNYWGEEKLAYAFYDYPETLHDMARAWLKMHCECTPRVLNNARIDYIFFHEDMAYKNGPLIGPNLFDRFMAPYSRELFAHLRACGQRRFMLDSDGNNGVVLERFVDLGMNGLYPFEVAAGCDAIAFRRAHPEFVIFGALDKRVLLKTREDIRREILEKVPVLRESGRFIPSFDHAIMPCPQENFEYGLELIRSCYS